MTNRPATTREVFFCMNQRITNCLTVNSRQCLPIHFSSSNIPNFNFQKIIKIEKMYLSSAGSYGSPNLEEQQLFMVRYYGT